MIERAVFLRDPVNAFTRNSGNLVNLTLSNKEWNQAEILLSILLPFKLVSDQLEQTKRPVIERVFWSYETMFNQIDIIEAKLRRGREPWLKELQKSVLAMTKKLKDYYARTVEAWVYSDGVLLNPWIKAGLFKNPSWRDDTRNWAEEYITACRNRYLNTYELMVHLLPASSVLGEKRKHTEFVDDYELFLQNQARQQTKNEFDHYMGLPTPAHSSGTALDWWKRNAKEYPRLSRMARDVLAVPATGAGVEREFSIAGKITTTSRACLDPATIEQTMTYKNHLLRRGHVLNFMKGGGMKLGEQYIEEDDEIPVTWRSDWWKEHSQD